MHRNLGVDVMEKCLSQYPGDGRGRHKAASAVGMIFLAPINQHAKTLQELALAADGDASWLEDQANQNRR